jgi:phosphatidylinositol-3-phosphatase
MIGWAAAAAQAAPPHIMVILMENHGAGSIIGNGAAPFENSLAKRYITLTNWTGVDHPSSPNYVALTTGQDNHKAGRNDCTPSYPKLNSCDYRGANLGVQLAAAGIPARWYAEDLGGNGCSIKNANSGRGDVNHEPWAYETTWQADKAACAEAGLTTKSRGDPQVISALNSATPPDFVWLTPNLIDDTHDGSIAQGNKYLKALITAVQKTKWYAANGTIVVTYDEDEGESNPPGYCTHPIVFTAVGRHCIATFIVSRADAGVGKVATPGDHYGLLRSIEEAYGLPLLNNAATSKYGDISRYLGVSAGLSAPGIAAGQPSVVRGIYRFRTQNWPLLANLGFNAATDGGVQEYGRAQAKDGLAGSAWLNAYNNHTCQRLMSDAQLEADVRANVRAGLRGLYYEVGDEPTAYGCKAEGAYRAMTAAIHRVDPTAITWTSDDQFNDPNPHRWPAGVPMAGTLDLLSFDVYPCYPHHRCFFYMIRDAIAQIRSAGLHQPWWFELQDFGTNGWRWPTAAELQQQYADWQGAGASGYYVYAWDQPPGPARPRNIATLKQINASPCC